MLRLIAFAFAAGSLAAAPVPASAAPQEVEILDGDCEVVRILPNGRKVVRAQAGRKGRGSHRSAVSSASGVSTSASGGSSVSVSSSSSSNGRSSAVASSTANGRTVTTTHDDDGCTTVIDDRGRRGGRR